jgi:hypothetical protein
MTTTNTVILYRAATNIPGDARVHYVSELPGQGGADWGYTTDRAHAIAVSPRDAKRFAAYCEHVGAWWFGSQPVGGATTTLLTESQLEAVWRRAGKAQDYTMCSFAERAMDGDKASARIVAASVRDVAIYAEAVRAGRS